MENKFEGTMAFLSQNWWQLGCIVFILFKVYFDEGVQNQKLDDHQARIVSLEQDRNMNITNWAVIRVQLSQIQSDISDIKSQQKSLGGK